MSDNDTSEEEGVISSTIKSTKNGEHKSDNANNSKNTKNVWVTAGGEETSPSSNEEFEDAEDDDWADTSLQNFDSEDGQMMIPIVQDKPNSNSNSNLNNENENLLGEGQADQRAQPQFAMPKTECWICNECNAINKLQDTILKHNLQCVLCNTGYDPSGNSFIYSDDWDEKQAAKVYHAWQCPNCTVFNAVHQPNCVMCSCRKPANVEVQYTLIAPAKSQQEMESDVEQQRLLLQKYSKKDLNINMHAGDKDQEKDKMAAGNYRHQNQPNQNKRQIVRSRLRNIGVQCEVDNYPNAPVSNAVTGRVTDMFGSPYRNFYFTKQQPLQKWTDICSVGHSKVVLGVTDDQKTNLRFLARGVALNARTGWLACSTCTELCVFKPVGANGFVLAACWVYTKNEKLAFQDISNSRVRFVNEMVYVFSFVRHRISIFKLNKLSKADDYYSLVKIDSIFDPYFQDSHTMDITIINDMLLILFDRWIGIYKLYPTFQWYHAVAFAAKAVDCFSFEVIDYDMPYADDKGKGNKPEPVQHEHENHTLGDDELKYDQEKTKNTNGNSNNDSNSDAFALDTTIERRTHRNFLYINTENTIIGVHPSHSTFDYFQIARNCPHGQTNFSVSKRYGCFWIDKSGTRIYQSPRLNHSSASLIFQCWNNEQEIEDFKSDAFICVSPLSSEADSLSMNIKKVLNLVYDETFGISGRLLVYCETKANKFVLHQMFNYNELTPLYEELSRREYVLMPGVSKKPYNLVVFVYEFVYGTDLIEVLLQSNLFNPALVKQKSIADILNRKDLVGEAVMSKIMSGGSTANGD